MNTNAPSSSINLVPKADIDLFAYAQKVNKILKELPDNRTRMQVLSISSIAYSYGDGTPMGMA